MVLRRLELPHSCPQCLQCTWYKGQLIDTAHNASSLPADMYRQPAILLPIRDRRAVHVWHQIHQHLLCKAKPVFSKSSCACLTSQCKVKCCSSIQCAQNTLHCQTRQCSQASMGQHKLWTLQCTYRRARLECSLQHRFQLCCPWDSSSCRLRKHTVGLGTSIG